jgi:hypothetical protein
MHFAIQFQFEDGPTLQWRDEKEKEEWALRAVGAITSTFNKRFRLKGKSTYEEIDWYWEYCIPYYRYLTKDCPCKGGYLVLLDLSYYVDGVFLREDYEVKVTKRTKGEAEKAPEYTNTSLKNAYVSDSSIDDYSYGEGLSQKTLVHEFGHMIGLDHPNKGGAKTEDEEYNDPATGRPSTSLMGKGMALETAYAEQWRKELNSQRDDCGPYVTELVN